MAMILLCAACCRAAYLALSLVSFVDFTYWAPDSGARYACSRLTFVITSALLSKLPCTTCQSAGHDWFSPGMRHPLSHLRGHAVGLLRAAGVRVDVLGEVGCRTDVGEQLSAQQACLSVNEVRPCIRLWRCYQLVGMPT
jgi:hypothetical protein